ncbi:MAG: radical SAM protein [Halobacteriales archaeon]|nr:radical SAM protein [Halobacteriales archaeon]
MPRTIQPVPLDGFRVGGLAEGCQLCEQGAKMVLFVSGDCHYTCFYCPIGKSRRNQDFVWADERKVDPRSPDALQRIFDEARSIDAKGTGITGGDPMYHPERVVAYIRALKAEFGPRHHIHLYTQIDFDARWLKELEQAGLDEIRFHPHPDHWADMAKSWHARLIPLAVKTKMEVSIEIPAIPGKEDATLALLEWADGAGVQFCNLNEFEWSEGNGYNMKVKGFEPDSDEDATIRGSREMARSVALRFARRKLAVHYCSSPFKDRIQLGQRLLRRAKNVAKPWEVITDDGTLLRGVVEAPVPHEAQKDLMERFHIPRKLIAVRSGKVEVAPWVLEAIAKDVPWPCYFSEVYPTDDALEVERTPLN